MAWRPSEDDEKKVPSPARLLSVGEGQGEGDCAAGILEGASTGTEGGSGAWDQVDLYRLFAFVFGAPSAERFAWLQRPELPAWLAELWDVLGCEGALPSVTTFPDYEDYESTYVALFEVGLPAPPVPLQESAHDDSTPAPQTVLENVSFYDVLGLRVDPARYAPDHLVPQLEFLSAVRYARETTPDADNRARLARLERDFLERHLLNWLSAAQRKLSRENPPIFATFMTLLLAFAQSRIEERSDGCRVVMK